VLWSLVGGSARIDDMKERLSRLELRASKKRELALQATTEAALIKLEQPDFTASARAGSPALVVVAEDRIPDAYWLPQPPKLDRVAPQLVNHLKRCAIALVKPESRTNGADHPKAYGLPATPTRAKIDKSALTISEPKRIRSKEHLGFVASQPCLICGRTPSHAHHIRYAQSRGLSLKVSDEFTVPLCAIHHHHIHPTGNERSWWQERNIDPQGCLYLLAAKPRTAGCAATRRRTTRQRLR
jgi:hypothetical protein